MTNRRVLVVGAGLSGALLSSTLTRKGFDVDVIEKALHFGDEDGAGLLLTGNGSKMLRALGRQDIVASGRHIDHVDLHTFSGQSLGRIECRHRDTIPFLSFKYSDLRLLLTDNVPVNFGVTVTNLRFDPSPVAILSDGSQQNYDLVIGADGVHSEVRDRVFGTNMQVEMDQFKGYRFLAPKPQGLVQPATFLGNGMTLLLVPLNNDLVYCGAGPISAGYLRTGETPRETIQQSYNHFGGLAADTIASLDDETQFIPSKFWTVKQSDWVYKSCVLIGDAAHAMPPTLSQGASMAFEDVFVLISCLERHSQIASALLEFQSRRRDRVDYVQEQSVARMYANQPIATHAAEMRLKISSLFGAKATMQLWERLIEEHP